MFVYKVMLKMDQNGLKYMVFGPKLPVFGAIFLANFGYPLPPKQKLVCQTKLAAMGVMEKFLLLKSFRKLGGHLEKSRQF